MKFIHTSDLHLGKRLGEASMLEDQEYILDEIIKITEAEKPHLFIIAGDLFDKSSPSAEAVAVLDNFLTRLAGLHVKVAVISGNHDSPERLAFGSYLIKESGVFVSPVYSGKLESFTVSDNLGDVMVWLMPYIRPGMVRMYADTEISNHNMAVSQVLKTESVDFTKRNILVSHQFVTGSLRSDSEEVSVGGMDNVDAAAFEGFDYVALGHIHRAQQCANTRYSGTPLKYSFSEIHDEKSLTVGELGKKGELKLKALPLTPLRDVREIKGSFEEIMKGESLDYVHICLTDEEELPDIMGRLKLKYINALKHSYQNSRTAALGIENYNVERKVTLTLFEEFYLAQNGIAMNDDQREYMKALTEEVKGI